MIGEENLNYHTNILYFSLKNTKYFYILADKSRKKHNVYVKYCIDFKILI